MKTLELDFRKRAVANKLIEDDISEIYESRKSRQEHPSGQFDSAGRWVPDNTEYHSCCRCIRRPSKQFPFSLMGHCRTKKHIAALVESKVKRYGGSVNMVRNVVVRHTRALLQGEK